MLKTDIQEKCEKTWLKIVERAAFFFLIFPLYGPMLRKINKIVENQVLEISKTENTKLCEYIGDKNSGEV